MKTLIIVESPTKAKKIQAFLGNNYIVKSSFGHIRDLKKGKDTIGIDIEKNFKPLYVITKADKVADLKKSQQLCSDVILASDLDREGEAIAWHLAKVLNLTNPKRIVFNSISKKAILESLKNPKQIDTNIVDAQQARRVLDRLVGFQISPLLWKHIENALSAGRVQSVTARLIMDKEAEIEKFESKPYYKTSAIFDNKLEGDLDHNFDEKDETMSFLLNCNEAIFSIQDIQTKKLKRYPAAPFRTSTLQQEAGRKLNMSSKAIMSCAQVLYENGHITYHRTDCVDISPEALAEIKEYILEHHGNEFLNIRKYKTKSKSAQEAHECIRPTHIDVKNLDETDMSLQQKKLYEIIWKRTIASQMSPCEVEAYTVKIDISNSEYKFLCKAEKIIFMGYKIIYDYKDIDDDDEDDKKSGSKMERNLKLIEKLNVGDILKYKTISSTEKFTKSTPRYTEATLTKKMEDLGIGRPATTASIITTIQDRKYVSKETRKGRKVPCQIYTLNGGKITEKTEEMVLDGEKNKLFPTELGRNVNNFLMENFPEIMDYKFTSNIEEEFDEIAKGKKLWTDVVKDVYQRYHPTVDKLNSQESKVINKKSPKKRLVGKEEKTGKNIYSYVGKFGPVLQVGETDPKFVSIKDNFDVDTINEVEANGLLQFPKTIGQYSNKDVVLKEGKFGIYISYNGKNYSIKEGTNIDEITLDDLIDTIKAKDDKMIKVVSSTCKIMNGQYGPFILFGKSIAPVPKDITDPSKLTFKECKEIVANYKPAPKKNYTKQNNTKKKN